MYLGPLTYSTIKDEPIEKLYLLLNVANSDRVKQSVDQRESAYRLL